MKVERERESQLNRSGGNKFQVKRCGSAELRHWSFPNGYHFQFGASRVGGNALKLFLRCNLLIGSVAVVASRFVIVMRSTLVNLDVASSSGQATDTCLCRRAE